MIEEILPQVILENRGGSLFIGLASFLAYSNQIFDTIFSGRVRYFLVYQSVENNIMPHSISN